MVRIGSTRARVDYAMNAACSAGTGSFLEESAQNDLGVPVGEIAGIAMAARSPVQFKATCAAFINSDIRRALQEGYSREDIVGGLVYSIAGNYLTKVKGPRPVGGKVFLQGGVAKNLALGHAFAHGVDREIVIPPSPELIGAQGVALLALRGSAGASEAVTDLKSLAASSMKRLGRFTCKACGLYCEIDRLEVAGRRFPFGGRCSLFENVWKRKSRTAAVPDLVERRAEILFGRAAAQGDRHGRVRIGIPKALTTHSLYPLYSTFFAGVGMEVILSDVDPEGELKSQSGFCFPAQIAHGAVLDLARKGVDRVFVPHVIRMPCGESKDSYLCPITQAGPYFLGKAFPDVSFLIYHSGYEYPSGEELEEGPYSDDTAHIGVNRLIHSLREAKIAPGSNVYAELGTTWFCLVRRPEEAAHVLGKLLLAVGEDNVKSFSDMEAIGVHWYKRHRSYRRAL